MTRALRAVVAAFAIAALPLGGSAESLEPETVARLDAAAAAHPDDPDLAWSAALAHAWAGAADAPERIAAFEARWPGLRRDAPLELGKALAKQGRDAEAITAFDRAVSVESTAGAAHLHRGIALGRLGRRAEADRDLARAAELDPRLAPEAALLRGIARMEAGERDDAGRLLRTAIELDPAGETGRRARLLLPEPSASGGGRWWSVMAQSGFEYDSNVTLDSGLPIAGDEKGAGDPRSVFSGGVTLRPIRGERLDLSLGYRFDGAQQLDLGEYDLIGHLGYTSLLVRATSRLSLRTDLFYQHAQLDGDGYGSSYLARQNLFHAWGDRAGTSRLYADVERQGYLDEPWLASLERDGVAWGVGLEHVAPVPAWRSAFLTLGLRHASLDTEADTDLLGFEGAYDHRRWETSLRLDAPLVQAIRATAAIALAREDYRDANVIDFLTDDAVGDPTPAARNDWVTRAAFSLRRPIGRWMEIEAGWRFTHRDSNVDLYAYDQHVAGIYMRFRTE